MPLFLICVFVEAAIVHYCALILSENVPPDMI
jgi:hypothetical protein